MEMQYMTACGVTKCPFYYKGVCRDRFTLIDDNGMCKQIWYRGQQRPTAFDPVDEQFKKEVEVVEVTDYKPVVDEPKKEEEYHQITFDEYMADLGTKAP